MSTPALKPLPSARSTTTWVARSLPAASSASATSYHPWTGSAFTGGKSIVTTRTPSSCSTDVTPMGPPRSHNQAFAWYSTRVSISLDLSGRVALVTGGSQGIGAGIAAVLVEAGATVVTCARSAVDDPAPGTTHVQCDVRDPEAVQALVDGVVAEHGRLDVLVNNAGGSPYSPAADASPRFFDKILGLNLAAPLVVSQAANAVMQRQGGGVIVNISSVSALRPSPGHGGVRRCQGRRGQPDEVAGRRVGPEGPGQHRRRRPVPHRADRRPLRRRRHGPRRSRRPSRSAGWPTRPRSATSWRSSPPTSRAMSPAPPWSATAAASHQLFLHVVQKEQQ